MMVNPFYQHQVLNNTKYTDTPVQNGMEINICDAPGCARPGKLVQQFVANGMGLPPFVYRNYSCQWHLGSQNRYRLNCQRKLSVIEYKTDAEVFEDEKPQLSKE